MLFSSSPSNCRQLGLVVLSLFFYGISSAQVMKLSISNPAPRVGDEVSVSYNVESDTERDKQGSLIGIGAVSFTPLFLLDTGSVKIGPISIKVNEAVLKTDSIVVHVSPALPPGIKEGLWIRQVSARGKGYIILEQRMGIDSNRKFSELAVEKVKKQGVAVDLDGSQQSEQTTLFGMVQYRISIYRLWRQGKSMKVDRSHFTNLPENVFFE
jgi:hypothetical protein